MVRGLNGGERLNEELHAQGWNQMMTALILALTMSGLKIEAPQLATQRIDLDLPGMPTAEGLQAPTAQPSELKSQQAVETGSMRASPARVEEVQLGKSFVATSRGLKAVEPVDGFLVTGLPAQLPTFKVCVRVSSPDKMPTRVKVQLRLPGGAQVLGFSKPTSFEREWTDVVFELAALKVQHAGVYTVVVSLDGDKALELPLEIREIKQAAVSSGR